MKKLPIIAVALLAVVGGVYKFVLAKPRRQARAQAAREQPRLHAARRTSYVDLQDGHYAKLSLGLEIAKKDPESMPPHTGETNATSPKGYGVMPEEGVVRDVVTADLTGLTKADFLNATQAQGAQGRARQGPQRTDRREGRQRPVQRLSDPVTSR